MMNHTQPTIEKATPADLEALQQLLGRQFAEHDIALAGEALAGAIAPVLDDERLGFFLLARLGGEIAGMAAVSFAWTLEHGGRSAWLDELYVRPRYRGRGLGTALLAGAEREILRAGCAAIDLEVDDAHARAERLYRRTGFRPLPRSRWVKPLEREAADAPADR
ncbi:MAG: GNAT family N-acetyltransferase [Anaerolineae bacterium]|jgi:GNAT superfamily N-acetyltransferase